VNYFIRKLNYSNFQLRLLYTLQTKGNIGKKGLFTKYQNWILFPNLFLFLSTLTVLLLAFLTLPYI
jgi:hypothetical protein